MIVIEKVFNHYKEKPKKDAKKPTMNQKYTLSSGSGHLLK